VESGVLHVDAPGGRASVEIVRSRTAINPELRGDGSVAIRIKIAEEGIIGSLETTEKVVTEEGLKMLERGAGEAIEAEVMAAVAQAKRLRADIFGFGEKINRKYPAAYKKMLENWDEAFSSLQIDVEAESKLRNTGEIVNPIRPGGAS